MKTAGIKRVQFKELGVGDTFSTLAEDEYDMCWIKVTNYTAAMVVGALQGKTFKFTQSDKVRILRTPTTDLGE